MWCIFQSFCFKNIYTLHFRKIGSLYNHFYNFFMYQYVFWAYYHVINNSLEIWFIEATGYLIKFSLPVLLLGTWWLKFFSYIEITLMNFALISSWWYFYYFLKLMIVKLPFLLSSHPSICPFPVWRLDLSEVRWFQKTNVCPYE